MTTTAKSVPTLPGPPRFHDKLCIVGFADGHRADAPFADETMEFWGINRLHVAMPGRWHRWFNLHDLPKFHGKDLEHLTWLETFGGPVYLRPDDIDKFQIPRQIAYPKQAVLEAFPRRYFNNTISWLLALAILMEYKEIHLYGVDMAQDDLLNAEYSHQRPSCEYFLGIAEARGITVVLPPGSDLLKTAYLYGFEDQEIWTGKLLNRLQELGGRKEQMKGRLAQIDNERGQLIAGINQLDGAMQQCQYNLKNWLPLPPGQPFDPSVNGHKEPVPLEPI